MAILYLPTDENITLAAKQLEQGNLVGVPTETVYGLAANATNDEAVEHIFLAKQRPFHKRLPVFVSDVEQAQKIALLDQRALTIAKKFWPGALTLVLPLKQDSILSPLLTDHGDSIAIRIPNHPVILSIFERINFPIVGTSANISGQKSPTCAQDVQDNLGKVAELRVILDDGECDIGTESTIIDLTEEEIKLIRPGAIPLEDILSVL